MNRTWQRPLWVGVLAVTPVMALGMPAAAAEQKTIRLEPTTLSLMEGQDGTLKATVSEDLKGCTLNWSSDKEDVATVEPASHRERGWKRRLHDQGCQVRGGHHHGHSPAGGKGGSDCVLSGKGDRATGLRDRGGYCDTGGTEYRGGRGDAAADGSGHPGGRRQQGGHLVQQGFRTWPLWTGMAE